MFSHVQVLLYNEKMIKTYFDVSNDSWFISRLILLGLGRGLGLFMYSFLHQRAKPLISLGERKINKMCKSFKTETMCDGRGHG